LQPTLGLSLETLHSLKRGLCDHLQTALQIQQHLVVPEAQHRKTKPFQDRRASLVARPAMLTTVHLDHQPRFGAKEVECVGRLGMLAPELQPLQPSVAQS